MPLPAITSNPNQPLIILPARLKSTRLPLKMLREVQPGLPLIIATALNALKATPQILVATDCPNILALCTAHAIPAILTPEACESGTDRLSFVMQQLHWGGTSQPNPWIINLQGDEPLLEPHIVHQLLQACQQNSEAAIITAAVKLQAREQWLDPNCVKLVSPNTLVGTTAPVLYFSRSPVPYNRTSPSNNSDFHLHGAWRHLGIYAYKASTLQQWPSLRPSLLEATEKLEQWRALENNIPILATFFESSSSISVDSEQDLLAVQAVFKQNTPPPNKNRTTTQKL